MKTIKLILTILIFLLAAEVYSQTFRWRLLPGSPGITNVGRFEDVYFTDANTGWINTYNKIYKTTDGGISWTLMYDQPGYNRSLGFFDSNTGLVGTLDSSRALSRTSNGGLNWTLITNFPNPKPMGVCGISIVNGNTAYMCGTYYSTGRVYKTSDKGVSWTLAFNDTSLARTLIDCYFWTADSGIAVGGYSTNNNFEAGNAVVIKTANGGTSWQRVHKTTRTGEWCWKIHFINRQVGYVSIEKFANPTFILKTVNGGNNWQEISLPSTITNLEGIGFLNENTGWVGGWGSNYSFPNYQTTNGGANWHLAGWGYNVNRFRFLNDTLAYSVGDRVYKYSRETVGINLISSEIPSSFQLHQNYPNPFNPVTVIRYSLIENRFVTLKVYDVLGNEIAILVNEKQNARSYSVDFDGSNFSSGIYFYKLETEDLIETKRMILLK